MDRVEEALRRLALNDEGSVGSALAIDAGAKERSGLDPKSQALVRLGSLVSREMVDTRADGIAEACEPLDKKGGAHESERQRVKTGTGY